METVYGEEDARQVIVDHAREDARVVSIAVLARVGIDTLESVDTFLLHGNEERREDLEK
jgi:hypothetical protein